MNISGIKTIDYNLQMTIGTEKEPPREIKLGDKVEFVPIKSGSADVLLMGRSANIGGQYTKEDALREEWEARYRVCNLNDPDVAEKLNRNAPTEEELNEFLSLLEQEGGSKEINFRSFQDILRGDVNSRTLSDTIEAFASQFAVASDKAEKNYSGEALGEQRRKLNEMYAKAISHIVEGYSHELAEGVGLPTEETEKIRNSLTGILADKAASYQKAYEGMSGSGESKDDWLRGSDNYMASQLRQSADVVQSSSANNVYSLEDLIVAGKVSEAYEGEISSAYRGGQNEVSIALNSAMIDMKTDKLIEVGAVGKNMAKLLRESRSNMQDMMIKGANSALQNRLQVGITERLEGRLDESMLGAIYNKVMDTYESTGGDAVRAIYEGVMSGKELVGQARANTPKVTRYINSMPSYLEGFFTKREPSSLEIYADEKLGSITKSKSAFEEYSDSFNYFLDTLQGNPENIHMNMNGGTGIPSYGNPNILDDNA